VDIISFIKDPKTIAGDLSAAQETALRLLYGLPLNDKQQAIARTALDVESVPQREYSEATYICGRRSGKGERLASNICIFEAVCGEHEKHLSKGERGFIMLIAQDKKACRVLFRYVYAKLESSPLLGQLIQDVRAEEIDLTNGLTISIFPASFKSSRGHAVPVCVIDELAFLKVEGVNVDREIIDSIRPAQAQFPRSKLIKISSPYAKAGELYRDYANRHKNPAALVFKLPSWTMNPSIPRAYLDSEKLRDPEYFDREFAANFSDSISNAFNREAVEACVIPDRHELPPLYKTRYIAACDASGGGADEFTLSICHRGADRIVQDLIRGWRSKNPQGTVAEITQILRRFGIRRITGDRYSAEWVASEFRKHGVEYVVSELTASEAFLELLPEINSGTVELLDDRIQTAQLIGLERRTSRSGKDMLGHSPGAHDDRCNSLAHCVASLSKHRPKRGAGIAIRRDCGMPRYQPEYRFRPIKY